MNEKAVKKLEYLRTKLTWTVRQINIHHLPNSLHVHFVGDPPSERSEIFTDIAEAALRPLLREFFPIAFGISAEDLAFTIYRNGEKLYACESEEEAITFIRQYAMGDWEAIYAIRDLSGSIIARYICDSNAVVTRIS